MDFNPRYTNQPVFRVDISNEILTLIFMLHRSFQFSATLEKTVKIPFISHFVVLNLGVLLDFDLCTCIGQQISNCGNHGVLQV